MSSLWSQTLIHFRDINEDECCIFYTTQLQDSSGCGAYIDLAVALQQCSDAAVFCIQRQTTLMITATPADGPYPTIFDRAGLYAVVTESGKGVKISVPAPKESIFKPDHVTVDLDNSDVMDLNDQSMALLGDQSGNANGPFKRGVRQDI